MVSKRVRECELSGSRDIAAKCFVLGLFLSPLVAVAVSVLEWFADQYGISDRKYIVISTIFTLCVFYLGIPWSILKEYHFHLRTRKLALLAAFTYAVGFHGCPAAAGLIAQDKYATFADDLLDLIGMTVSVLVVTTITWGFAIVACNHFAKKYPVQISLWPPKCRLCNYDLTGNRSKICPECGNPFSYDEFGITESEFRDLQRITKPVTRENLDQ